MATTTKLPVGLKWRSSIPFILSTIGIGMFTDLFLYGLIVPILPFLLPARLHTPPSEIQSQTSLLIASYAFAQVLLSLPIGSLADRLPSRQPPFIFGLVALLLSTTLLYLGNTFPLLILARILQGISAATVWTIGLAMIIETVGSEKLGVTIGTIFGFISIGELAAPVLGGVLYDKVGYGAVFGVGLALILVDLTTRLCVIERKVAERLYGVEYDITSSSSSSSSSTIAGSDEETPLLSESTTTIANNNSDDNDSTTSKNLNRNIENDPFLIPSTPRSRFHKTNPILYPLTHTRTLTAMLLTLVQPLILSIFDATLPLHAQELFGFTSLQSGILFLPLIVPSIIMGPIFGRMIDKYGVKPMACTGLFLITIPLILLRLPHTILPFTNDSNLTNTPSQTPQIAFFSILLLLIAIPLSLFGSPGLVEASYITEQYHLNNPGTFGDNGPYGRLYAVNSLVFSFGLTIGPMLAGWLRESVGYGNMNAVVAGICAATGVVCWKWFGGPPRGFLGLGWNE